MKRVLINTRIFAIALAITSTTAFSTPALAIEEKKAIPVELTFLGNVNSQPVIQLNFTNSEVNEYTVVIRDSYGMVLYKDKVKGRNMTQKFILNTEDLGGGEVHFEITGSKNDKTARYEVNTISRMVEDVVVSKVK
jgi:hypothetical protein